MDTRPGVRSPQGLQENLVGMKWGSKTVTYYSRRLHDLKLPSHDLTRCSGLSNVCTGTHAELSDDLATCLLMALLIVNVLVEVMF